MLDDKPLSVPRDIDLRLDTSPITAVDALGNPPSSRSTHRAPIPCTHPTALHPGPPAMPGCPWWDPRGAVTCPPVSPPPVLRYFLEYQWFVDFAVYSTAVYVFTEGYFCLADPKKETNIGVLWCLLTVVFSVYPSAGAAQRWGETPATPPGPCRRWAGGEDPKLLGLILILKLGETEGFWGLEI